MANNFISSNDSNETLTMNYVRDDTEIVIGYETDEIIDQIFDSLLQRYKKGLEDWKRYTKAKKKVKLGYQKLRLLLTNIIGKE